MLRHTSLTLAFAAALAAVLAASAFALTRDDILDKGLRNNEAYSISLVEKAREAKGDDREALLTEARNISPDYPAIYFKLAWAKLPNVFASIGQISQGFKAYGRNFWWLMSLQGLLFVSMLLSLAITLALIAFMRLPMDMPLILHDINETKSKLLLVLLLLPLGALGLPLFLAGALLLTSLYVRKWNKAPFYVAVALVISSPFALPMLNNYVTASTPVMSAIVAVNEGKDNRYAIEILGGRKDFASQFSYATALKREGRTEEAIAEFKELLQTEPDFRVYVNLGTAFLYSGNRAYAIRALEKAKEKTASVTALYNLSQLYREDLNFQVGDRYYEEAYAMGGAQVTRFTSITSKHPNRLVIDETLGPEDYMKVIEADHKTVITPYLVGPAFAAAAGVIVLIIFIAMDFSSKHRAFRCSKCGRVACALCSDPKQWNQLCLSCQNAQNAGEEDTSARARVARMISASEEKDRQINFMRMLSFAPPGVVQIYSGRTLQGLIFMWLFSFCVVTMVMNPLFSTGMADFSHWWLYLVLTPAALLTYYFSFSSTNARLDNGWL